MTGLPNGRALRTWLEHHLPRANEVQSHTALLVIPGNPGASHIANLRKCVLLVLLTTFV